MAFLFVFNHPIDPLIICLIEDYHILGLAFTLGDIVALLLAADRNYWMSVHVH